MAATPDLDLTVLSTAMTALSGAMAPIADLCASPEAPPSGTSSSDSDVQKAYKDFADGKHESGEAAGKALLRVKVLPFCALAGIAVAP